MDLVIEEGFQAALVPSALFRTGAMTGLGDGGRGGSGGREGIRTPGLLVANEALSQLSYSPTSSDFSILAEEKKEDKGE